MRVTRPIPVDALAPGQTIGPFVLLGPLGSGGSGRIWAAARLGQLGFNKRLVLKVMREDQMARPSARRRFDREACLGGRLHHPNVRAVHDLGSVEGRPYMALSWVDASLAELLQHAPGERLAPAVVCWIGIQCCAALSAAHGWVEQDGRARAIVHRDVSPGNILLSVDGHALLADLAPPEDEDSPGAESSAPRFFGNLAYAAPEALHQQVLDPRADLYSLGCVLYEALAGAPAFEGDDERAVMFQIVERGAPDLATRAPAVPADLASVVQRCLARRRDERFESALELRAALSACCRERPAFSLERETAALIRDVLGARIREREEMMHQAFERFATSALGRTDTLPIGQAEPEAPRVERPSVSAVPAPSSAAEAGLGRRRWVTLAALFALLALVGVFARSRPRLVVPQATQTTQANRAAPEVPSSASSGGSSASGTLADGSASGPSPGDARGADAAATAPNPSGTSPGMAPPAAGARATPEATPRNDARRAPPPEPAAHGPSVKPPRPGTPATG